MADRAMTARSFGLYGAIRNKTMPQSAGSPLRKASSPKSLSKVSKTRRCAMHSSKTSMSVAPEMAVGDPRYVHACIAQRFKGRTREVFIGQEPHIISTETQIGR